MAQAAIVGAVRVLSREEEKREIGLLSNPQGDIDNSFLLYSAA